MEKTFENVFELFDLSVRRLRNGNKIKLTFESPENIDTEKKLIEFRGQTVQAIITQSVKPQKKEDVITIEGQYEVFELKCRRLRNGDKLQLVLEKMYDKDNEIKAVRLRYVDCKVHLTSVEQELDFDDEGEEEEEDDQLQLG